MREVKRREVKRREVKRREEEKKRREEKRREEKRREEKRREERERERDGKNALCRGGVSGYFTIKRQRNLPRLRLEGTDLHRFAIR